MKITLSPAERSALRARAHHLQPVVMIGNDGLTPAVLHEIDVNLNAHELIKIRVFADERPIRVTLLAQIADQLDAAPVQHIGKLLVLFRPLPDERKPAKPQPAARTPVPRTQRPGAKRSVAKRPAAKRPQSRPGSSPRAPEARGIPGRRRRPPQA